MNVGCYEEVEGMGVGRKGGYGVLTGGNRMAGDVDEKISLHCVGGLRWMVLVCELVDILALL